MENKYILKIFINFLKKEGIYTYYLKALEEDKTHYRKKRITSYRSENPVDFIVACLNYNKPYMLIDSAFDWTAYQNANWYNLTQKWDKILYEKGIIEKNSTLGDYS